MSMHPSRCILPVLLATSFAAGCSNPRTPAPTLSPVSVVTSHVQCDFPTDQVVATFKVDGAEQKVTYGELVEYIGAPLAEFEKKKLRLLKEGVEGYVLEQIVKAEATNRGLPNIDALIKAEVEDKVPAPTDAEILKLFNLGKSDGQLPRGVTMKQVKPEIVKMLTEQAKQEKARALFTELKDKADINVQLPERRAQVAAIGPAKGPESAPITIIEFSDFQCPFCGKAKTTVDDVVNLYGDRVRLVFRHFPLPFHESAPKAAEAAACAQDQDKFWEYHDKLFANQQALKVEDLKKYAADLGLNSARFNECLDSGKKADLIKKDMNAGEAAGVSGTPTFFINGIGLSGAVPSEDFKTIIDSEMKKVK